MKTYLLLAIALLVTSSVANAQKSMEGMSMPAGSTKFATKPVGLLADAEQTQQRSDDLSFGPVAWNRTRISAFGGPNSIR
jgi:hypothetical protein